MQQLLKLASAAFVFEKHFAVFGHAFNISNFGFGLGRGFLSSSFSYSTILFYERFEESLCFITILFLIINMPFGLSHLKSRRCVGKRNCFRLCYKVATC